MLLERHRDLLGDEIEWAGGENMFINIFGTKIKTTANNERSMQNKHARQVYLSKANPEYNTCRKLLVHETDTTNDSAKPQVEPDIRTHARNLTYTHICYCIGTLFNIHAPVLTFTNIF